MGKGIVGAQNVCTKPAAHVKIGGHTSTCRAVIGYLHHLAQIWKWGLNKVAPRIMPSRIFIVPPRDLLRITYKIGEQALEIAI